MRIDAHREIHVKPDRHAVPARRLLAGAQLVVRDPLHELVEFASFVVRLPERLQIAARRVIPGRRPFRPRPGRVLPAQAFEAGEAQQRVAFLLTECEEVGAPLFARRSAEMIVRQAQAGELDARDTRVVDHVARS